MSAKMAANGIRTHVRNNQRRTLESSSRQSLCELDFRVRLWLVRAWVRILFAAIFANIPRADKAIDFLSSLFIYDTEALIAQ